MRLDFLVGHKIVEVNNNIMTLDDGTTLEFDAENEDCCSWFELDKLHTCDNIITKVEEHAQYESGCDRTGLYTAQIYVLTDGGEGQVIAEGNGDASNGYYLSGFALDVKAPNKIYRYWHDV